MRLMATDAMPEGVTDTSWLPSKGRVGFGIDFAVRIRARRGAVHQHPFSARSIAIVGGGTAGWTQRRPHRII